ncbi:MAG: DUF4091 domain-containing protein, partial [Phycisphaerae bacterium]|nr:DUF4091 domain-containing protein [Phycisphaerae bacterium]
WHIFSVDFRVPDNTEHIQVALYIKGVGTVWFDEVLLETCFVESSSVFSPSEGAYVLRQNDPMMWFEFAEHKIFRDTPPPKTESYNKIAIKAARNENEQFQICIKPDEDCYDCTINFTDLVDPLTSTSIESANLTSYRVGFVEVEDISSAIGIPGSHADFLVNSDTYYFVANINNPIYINVWVPYNTPPGIYRGTIAIRNSSNLFVRIPLEVEIWPFTVPNRADLYVRSNFWLSLIKKYDRRPNEEILADYYQNLQEHRVNAFSTIDLETEIVGDSVVFFFEEFGRKIKVLFENYGFEAITVGPFLGDAAGWKYRRNWMGLDPGSARFERLFKQYCHKLESYLIANGWIDRCWIGYWDEPQLEDPDYDRIVRIGNIIKETAPNLKIFMTMWPTLKLFGIVDIWCLPFTERAFNKQDIAERKTHGDRIFVYHNDPYIDTPLIDKRLYAWRYRLADIDGVYAWWNLTFWQKDPYDFSSQVERKGAKDDTLKPGDGVLLYPNPAGAGPPVNSLRWETFRQGLEDYEYLYLLEETIRNAMRRLDITADFSDYADYRINEYLDMVVGNYFNTWTRDVDHLYNVRTRIAEEIQTTEQSPVALIKTHPQEGPLESGKVIKISGLVEAGTKVVINDKPVPVTDRGTFVFHIKNPADGAVVIKLIQGTTEKILRRFFA